MHIKCTWTIYYSGKMNSGGHQMAARNLRAIRCRQTLCGLSTGIYFENYFI